MALVFLNFHGVGPIPRKMDDEERECWIDQDFFEAVLDLAKNEPHVRFTFDDGNASDIEIALPALVRRGLTAIFFVCTSRLGLPTFLSRDQVHELHARGMSIGSHGVNHLSWRHITCAQLHEELQGSRDVLESVCNSAVDAAACPLGSYDRRVLKGLRRTGYRYVYTSDGGAATEKHWLRARTTVGRLMSLDDVERLIRSGPGRWNQISINLRTLLKRLR
jgi:peptidoglycan/xylan/chitin deacetylase (PgdA/CDA1 family)